jgi:hypothetical protein
LFSVAGPAGKYEALDRAFSIFAEWIDQEDEARRAIERRHQAEAWQRDWEAKRLAEESDHARRRGESAFDEPDPHMRVASQSGQSSHAVEQVVAAGRALRLKCVLSPVPSSYSAEGVKTRRR